MVRFADIVVLVSIFTKTSAREYVRGGAIRSRSRKARPAVAAFDAGVGLSLAGCTASGVLAERTHFGRRVTGALTSFSVAAVASNLKWLPPAHPLYDACWAIVLPSSLAVTVLGSALPCRLPRTTDVSTLSTAQNKVHIRRHSRSLRLPRIGGVGLAFGVGACGSLVGAAAAFQVAAHVAPQSHALWLPPSLAAQCAACCAATYIGGSANLFAVAQACGLARDHTAALGALAAGDVLCMGGYFAFLVALSQSARVRALVDGSLENNAAPGIRAGHADSITELENVSPRSADNDSIYSSKRVVVARTFASISLLLLAGILLQITSTLASAPGFQAVPGIGTGLLTLLATIAGRGLHRLEEGLTSVSTAIRLTTTVGLDDDDEATKVGKRRGVAGFFRTMLQERCNVAPPIASALLLLFFAAVGSSARVDAVAAGYGPALVAFVAITLSVHCAFMSFAVCALNQCLLPRSSSSSSSNSRTANAKSTPGVGHAITLDEALVASNANVGGPATAAGFAGSLLNRPDLVPSAAGWGTLGYALASSLALGLHAFLIRS